jgi:hypothetical protein
VKNSLILFYLIAGYISQGCVGHHSDKRKYESHVADVEKGRTKSMGGYFSRSGEVIPGNVLHITVI